MMDNLVVQPPAATLNAGVTRTDITAPVGIYSRMWGAAKHDVAEGVHRPLTATVLALEPEAGDRMILVSMDWVVTPDLEVMQRLRAPLVAHCGGDEARVIIAHTHTHGIGFITPTRRDLPGGHLIEPYIDRVCNRLADAADTAVAQAADSPSTLTCGTGRCDLAVNRDLPDPMGSERYLTGYNPTAAADDTLLVARITRNRDDQPLATIVNYACHPTTLAWDNRLLSPDYIGAMRQLVEGHNPGLCLFLQGASGELSPAHQYSGDTALADQHGRRLGHAVLSVLEGMLPPRQALAYSKTVESGAPLAVWRPQSFAPSTACGAILSPVDLPLRQLPSTDELTAELERATERHSEERARRKLRQVDQIRAVGQDGVCGQEITAWRTGSALFVATPSEPYSSFQMDLRNSFPDAAVFVVTAANSGVSGYLVPADLYDRDLYQVWQSPYAADALATLQREAAGAVSHLLTAS